MSFNNSPARTQQSNWVTNRNDSQYPHGYYPPAMMLSASHPHTVMNINENTNSNQYSAPLPIYQMFRVQSMLHIWKIPPHFSGIDCEEKELVYELCKGNSIKVLMNSITYRYHFILEPVQGWANISDCIPLSPSQLNHNVPFIPHSSYPPIPPSISSLTNMKNIKQQSCSNSENELRIHPERRALIEGKLIKISPHQRLPSITKKIKKSFDMKCEEYIAYQIRMIRNRFSVKHQLSSLFNAMNDQNLIRFECHEPFHHQCLFHPKQVF